MIPPHIKKIILKNKLFYTLLNAGCALLLFAGDGF